MDATQVIEEKFRALAGRLDEATLRLWAARSRRALGHGGVSAVASAVGLFRTTLYAGLRELAAATSDSEQLTAGVSRVRAKGGGRKKLTARASTLLRDLDALVEPTARGDPQSPLHWACSTPRLAEELVERGHQVSPHTVCDLLARLDYTCKRPGRFTKGGGRPIATPSSAILSRRRRGIRRREIRWYPLIPKRKNGSRTSRTAGVSGR